MREVNETGKITLVPFHIRGATRHTNGTLVATAESEPEHIA
jgi:hypothetical protein